MNRPDRGNSIDKSLAEALTAALGQHGADPTLRSVVISGAGEKFFCAGGDIKAYALLQSEEELNNIFGITRDLLDTIEQLPVPVIAALNGYAIGGGAELALACDIRVMAMSAQISFPQVRLGIMPGWDGATRLVSIVGRPAATKLLLLGERMSAEDALAIGFADEVVADAMLFARTAELARAFEQTAPRSVAMIKTTLRNLARQPFQSVRATGREAFAQLWFSADHKEAEQAFAEKRAPVFTGE
ncbi:MAG: enoyl-CoA hydratase/isomerase family protein [Nitrosospira sp.]|nr:enoyl-CoA hydratase/isomerase family protein [Nitrosospira sp.]